MKPHAQPGGIDPVPVGQPGIDAGHRELQDAYAQQRDIVHALGASSTDFIYIVDRAQRFIVAVTPRGVLEPPLAPMLTAVVLAGLATT